MVRLSRWSCTASIPEQSRAFMVRDIFLVRQLLEDFSNILHHHHFDFKVARFDSL